ncbi:hypothetical protein X733_33445 [Mesorhizobium sp. L2C067A000]|nr:hypothetical protein X733_33445 [Mesorhizobium sp. L2C067A000]
MVIGGAGRHLLPPRNQGFKTRANWPNEAKKTFSVAVFSYLA